MSKQIIKAFNMDISVQKEALIQILEQSEVINEAINRAISLGIKEYYIGAGFIAGTVWNHLAGYSLTTGIKDIDFVYFDGQDLSSEKENYIEEKVINLYKDIPLKIDVKNQARVHLWYERKFGYKIQPYNSIEEAINTWPTTATALGVRKESDGAYKVYAPFGLNDLFGKIVRANKTKITKEIYENKVNRWTQVWTDLNVVPWENS